MRSVFHKPPDGHPAARDLRRWGVGRVSALALLLAGLAVTACTPAQPDAPKPRLRGVVLGADGLPVAGARLEFEASDASVTSNGDGKFAFVTTPEQPSYFVVHAGRTTSFEVDSFLRQQRNRLKVHLDGEGAVENVEVTRRSTHDGDGWGEAIRRLVPPPGSPNPDARGKLEIEEEEDGHQGFEIAVDGLPAGDYQVFLQSNPIDPVSLQPLSLLHVGDDGAGELYFHSDNLPFGLEFYDIFQRKVEIRRGGILALQGTIPPILPTMGGVFEGEGHLDNVGARPGAEAEIEIESKPIQNDERFEVELEDVDPGTYVVCVECAAVKPNRKLGGSPGGVASGAPRPDRAAAPGLVPEATLFLAQRTAGPGDLIEIPISVLTSRDMTYLSFVVEFPSTHLGLRGVVAGTDAVAAGFTSVESNNFPDFTPALADSHVVVQVSNPSGTGTIQGGGVAKEIARLRFVVGNHPGETAPLLWDRSVPSGLLRTFLEVVPQVTLAGEPSLEFHDGSVMITGGQPSAFECIGSIVIPTGEDEDEGELELRSIDGDRLPCGVQHVGDLQTIAGRDRRVVVRLGNENGPIVFQGTVPHFGTGGHHDSDDGDDDDDDDDDDDLTSVRG